MSPSINPLFQAILDNPDDDAPRLVYADWLDEHGDPDRAEYIRLRIGYVQARLKLGNQGHPQFEDRIEELEKLHRRRWVAQLPRIKGITWDLSEEYHAYVWAEYRRGFAWSITSIHGRAFIDNATRLFSAAPIQALFMRGLAGAKRLVKLPQLARLRVLDLANGRLDADDVAAIAQCPYLGNLRHLNLSYNPVGDDGAMALANSPVIDRLEELSLGAARITNDGVRALVRSKNLRNLKTLILAENDCDDDAARALHKSPYLSKDVILYVNGWPVWERTYWSLVKRFRLVVRE